MQAESCAPCAGEGRIGNSFGRVTTCPSCHGSGRRNDEGGYRDVTKTKPSHHAKPANAVAKQTWPTSGEGSQLATEVRDSSLVTADIKTRLIQEIMDHEGTHGRCTQTFAKKIRKQVRVTPSK